MSNPLTDKHCKPCEGGTQPLAGTEMERYLKHVGSDWSPGSDNKSITATFKFKNYYQTQAFVNAVAWVAHREDHHPDINFGYNKAKVTYSTHAIGGLSENDFICAAKVNALLGASA